VTYLRGDAGKEEFQGLRGFLFFTYLGGNISSALINLSQVPMFTAPWLTQHTSIANVGRLLRNAYSMAVKDPRTLHGNLRTALIEAEEEGITNPQNVYTTMAIGSGSKLARIGAVSNFLDMWASMFSKAETLNRRVSFISAYQLAGQKGMAGQEAFGFAAKAVRDTQFLYNKGNRPVLARGIGAVPFTFRLFTIQALETIFAKMPPKQAAMILGLLLLGAGGEGLPFVEDIEDIIDSIGQKMGYATNSKQWLAEQLQTAFEEWAGLDHDTAAMASEVTRKGIFSQTPFSIGPRLGMGNIIPGSSLFKTSADKGREITDAIGPVAGLAKNLYEGSIHALKGDFGNAAEKAAPTAISNAMKGARQLREGEERTPTGMRIAPVTSEQAIGKVVGFNPQSVSHAYEKSRALRQDESFLKQVESDIAAKWAQGVFLHRPEQVEEARAELREHNEKNPNAKIRITPNQIHARVKNMRMDGERRLLKSVPKERRAEAVRMLHND